MNQLPSPLTPEDCDLRGLEYMPLLGNHLFGSDFNAKANDTEFRVALTLWWKAWTQKPAASLPDDDIALCRFAELGRDMRTWKRIKKVALHGFVKCSDGRLYHPMLAEQALIAWEKRVNDRKRKAEWRRKKCQEEAGQQELPLDENQPLSENGHADVRVASASGDRSEALNRRDGTGRDVRSKSQANPRSKLSNAEPTRANGFEPPTAELAFNDVCRAANWSPGTDDKRMEALSTLRGWLLAGLELERDILAGIGKARAKRPSDKTSSLKRFESTIAGIHKDRTGRTPDLSASALSTAELTRRTAQALSVGEGRG